MCGIVGYISRAQPRNWPLIKHLLDELLIAAEVRGHDATGFYAVPSRRGQRGVLSKCPVPATEFVETTPAWHHLGPCRVVLAHTRMATHGSPKDHRNNHPFVSDDGRFAVVHNGVITNHREVAFIHDLDLRSACDSEVILRLVEAAGCGATGLQWALQRCRGAIATAVYDGQQQTVWLARNEGRPLVVCQVRGIKGTFIASTPELMITALQRVLGESPLPHMELLLPLAAEAIIGVRPDGSVLCVDAPTTAEAFRFP